MSSFNIRNNHSEPSLPFPDRIIVRQTLDPYHEIADVQYIAQSRITLSANGFLDLSKLGVGKPGDQFVVSFLLHFMAFSLYFHWHCRRDLTHVVSLVLTYTRTLSPQMISNTLFSMRRIQTQSLSSLVWFLFLV
jgi:hypothetical protein